MKGSISQELFIHQPTEICFTLLNWLTTTVLQSLKPSHSTRERRTSRLMERIIRTLSRLAAALRWSEPRDPVDEDSYN